jgi:ADP-heptose:LPS heptosyltransferase
VLNYILKPLLRKSPLDPKNIPEGKIKNILIVKQHNQLGDMLCSLPLFAAVRNKFRDSYITLVASKDNFEIFNSRANQYFDKLILFDKSSPKTIINFIRQLRSRKYEIGIVPSTVSFSHTSHLINYISGAATRTGVRSADKRFNKYEYLLNVKSDFNWDKNSLHQIYRNLEIGELIGCSLTQEQINEVNLELSSEENRFAEDFKSNNFNNNNITIGFHPGAGKPPNRWKTENFNEIIEKLNSNFNPNIIITSGPMDSEVVKPIKEYLSGKKIRFTVSENTPLRNTAAIISKLDLYITNDTGPMHIANYLRTPVIALFGPTNGFEWGPVFKHQAYIQSPSGNINDISTEIVYNKALSILKETKKI